LVCDLQSSDYPNYKVAGETACDKFNALTVFDRITASPEVLAEKLVYRTIEIAVNRVTYSCWKSTITEEKYRTKDEAIAATVAKLREVEE
jgi:hypothetical protein